MEKCLELLNFGFCKSVDQWRSGTPDALYVLLFGIYVGSGVYGNWGGRSRFEFGAVNRFGH